MPARPLFIPRRLPVLILGWVTAAVCALGADGPAARQFWPQVDVFVRTGYATRLYFTGALTREQGVGTQDALVGSSIEFGMSPLIRELFAPQADETEPFGFLRFRVGGLFMRNLNDDIPSNEWRGMVELTPRATFGPNLVTMFRNRLEFRWIEGTYSFRYRPRLWLEHTFYTDGTLSFTPYVNCEAFYDSRFDSFVRILPQVGVSVGVTGWFAPEISFGVQSDREPREVTTVFLGLTTTFFF